MDIFSGIENSHASRRIASLAACALLGFGAFAMRPAGASGIPVCVSTNTEFKNALASAEFVPTTIKMVRGDYNFANSVWDDGWSQGNTHYVQPGSELLGGYATDCASRNIDVGNTTIGYTGGSGFGPGVTFFGDLTIEGLTFSTGVTWSAFTDGDAQAEPTFLLRRDAFTGGGGVSLYWALDEDVGGTIRVVDTLIAGNAHVDCSLYVAVSVGTPAVQWIENTIVDNTGATQSAGSGACMYNHFLPGDDGHGTLAAYNNIFYGNTGRNLDTSSDVLLPALVDNVIGTHHTPGAVEIGTLNTDPRLDANYRPIESPPSPVINTGSTTAPGGLPATDLPGRTRVVGTAPDRGAYESSVDDSFLQSVSNTSDSGAGSLRTAILGANAHGSGLITFDLGSGCGPHVITLSSPLPSVTVPLIVNGYSQTGASANDLDIGSDATFCVILESGDASVTKALQIPTSAGDGVSLFVEGLAFSGFSEAAIALGAGSGNVITGNRFGGSVGNHQLLPNGAGIRLDANAHDSTVGGQDPADRNIIGGSSTGSGIDMFGSLTGATPVGTHNDQIINNLIGVDWTGGASGHFTALGNAARGIYLAGYDNEISGNWIGDNAQAGIGVVNGGAQNNTIESNFIGFVYGTAQGNGASGIHMQGDAGDAPTANVVRYNTIAANDGPGVWVAIGQQNRIRRNSIYDNVGLGIDLDALGILPNDTDADSQPPDYANRGLNYPVLEAALGGSTSGTFTGSLESTLGDYRIDFYQTLGGCEADNRQAEFWIGVVTVTISKAAIGGDGDVAINAHLGPGAFGSIVPGAGITATTTDAAGNTSELSACVPFGDDTIFANGFEQQA